MANEIITPMGQKALLMVQEMQNFGLSPKEALEYWAIGDKLYPKQNPVRDPSFYGMTLTPTQASIAAGGATNQRGNYRFWNTIDPTCYLSTAANCKKYNYSKYFLSKLNQKLQKMALRIAGRQNGNKDIDSGMSMNRIGGDLIALQEAIKSGNVDAIVAATKRVVKNKDFKSAGEALLVLLPADKVNEYASKFGGDVLKKYNVDIGAAIKDPAGYLKKKGIQVAQDKAKETAMNFFSSKDSSTEVAQGSEIPSKEEEGFLESFFNGYSDSDLGCYGCYSGLGSSTPTASSSYRLTPGEEKIAIKIYENTYRLFQPVWALKDNPSAFWPAFTEAVKQTEAISADTRQIDKITDINVKNYDPSLIGVLNSDELKNISSFITPLSRAFAISSLFTSSNRFAVTDKMVYFKEYLAIKGIIAREQAIAARSDIKIGYDDVDLNREDPSEYQEVDFESLASKLKTPTPTRTTFSNTKAMSNIQPQADNNKSNWVPITLGVVALGGLSYYFYSQKKR